ncbi:MAG TPA: hypothetical protein VK150_06950, partial [Geothrix sp.]|nr:hypothetical protein [Geothrix sp.]
MDALTRTFRIDPEFRDRIPAPNAEAFAGLEADILADGAILDPLKIWQEEGILLDGHHRYTLAQKHGIPFQVHMVSLPDRDAALDWIDRHAIHQRNLPPKAESMIRGRIYNRAKKAHGGQIPGSSGQSDHSLKTAQDLAPELGVSEKTLRRDGEFAEAVDKLHLGPEVTQGKVQAPRAKVIKVAKDLPENPTPKQVEKAKKVLEAPESPKPAPKKPDDKDARIVQLERLLAERDGELSTLKAKVSDLQAKLAEAGCQVEELHEENESMRRILEGDDRLKSMLEEVGMLREKARVAESQRNGYMDEAHDLAKRLKSANRKIQKQGGKPVDEPKKPAASEED